MMSTLAQDIQRPQASFKNSPLLFGPQITNENEIKRPVGYALPGCVALSVTAKAGGYVATGYGEGSLDIARKKAISEAFERLALFKYCADKKTKETSSGWAAHFSSEMAIHSAMLELIERDVALSAWENGGPFFLIPENLWPQLLLIWKEEWHTRLEFSDLRILLSRNDNGACISVLLFNERGNFVAGHASALNLEDAILSAANECFRAAHSAIQFEYLAETATLHASGSLTSASPGAHSLAYAYKETIPEVVRILSATEKEILSQWETHISVFKNLSLAMLDTQVFQVGDRMVARVKSSKHREIFWGRTNDVSKRNQHPHFVG